MSARSRNVGVPVAVAVLTVVLAACGKGSAPPSPLPSGSSLSHPGKVASGISLSADLPNCSEAGDQQLCSVTVWYVNMTGQHVTIDATRTVVIDSSGAAHTGTADAGAATLGVDARARRSVLWGYLLPTDMTISGVVWASGDGSTAGTTFGQSPSDSGLPTDVASQTPSSTAPSSTAPTTPTPPPTTPSPASTTPTPSAVSSTPTVTPTPTPTPSPKPTPKPTTPVGTIG